MKKTYGIAAILAAGLFLCTACGVPENSPKKSEYEIWRAPNTLKVLQDAHLYESYKGAKSVSLTVARGEYESAQLILEAKTKLASYNVNAFDLADGDGNVFHKENIAVYAEKYILVDTINEQNGAPIGYYPDCLVPIENYGSERSVAANNNQGLWITFRIPKDAVPGTYSGKLDVIVDGETNEIPVTLHISELIVSEEVRTKSVFLNQFDYYKGELDTTLSMFKKYNDALIEFRLAPDVLNDRQFATEEGYALYAELAYEYAVNPRCSNYSVPYEKAGGKEDIDEAVMTNYLTALVEKSFEKKVDILEKAVFYCRLIDEPSLKQIDETVKNVCGTFRACLEKVAAAVEEGYPEAEAELKASVARSVRNIKNVVTTERTDRFEGDIECWCPTVDHYNTEEERADYADQEERWWYTCTVPKTPYPTYHMEDGLISARLMGWMQADYDVTGNLYWATNFSSEMVENDVSNVWLEDYYQTADRYKGANGDGFLFYPGKMYGVDGPLASLRLHAIRDGLEEYELLYDLKEKYRQTAEDSGVDFTADDVVDSLAANLYDGTRVSTTDEKLAAAREGLFELAELARSEAGVCIAGFEETNGVVKYEVVAEKSYPLFCDGVPCERYEESGNYRVYTVEKRLSEAKNTLSLSVTCGEKTYEYRTYLGGKYNDYAAEEIAEWFHSGAQTVEASDYIAGAEGKAVKVAYNGESGADSVRMTGSLSANFNAGASRLRITLHNPGTDAVEVYLGVKYRDTSLKQKLVSDRPIAPGESITIDIKNIYGFSWNLYGGTQYIELGVNGGAACELLVERVELYME